MRNMADVACLRETAEAMALDLLAKAPRVGGRTAGNMAQGRAMHAKTKS